MKYSGPEIDTKEGLEKLYNSSTCKEICKKFNINEGLLYNRLKKFKIPLKSKKYRGPELDTKEGLEKLYNSSTCKEICKKHNISWNLLYQRLKKFGIPVKPQFKQQLTKEWFEEHYYNQKLSKTQLTTKSGASIHTINRLFKKYQIKGRSFREAGLMRSETIRNQMYKQWQNPEYVKKMSTGFNSVKERMAHLSNNQLGKISSIQKILYSILDELHIKYEKEKIIGFWTYDCLLPDYNLIIECQGDYWHNLTRARRNDQAKATYLESYFPQYKLKHLWEHEFMCKDRIIEYIKYWTGIRQQTIEDFDFNNLHIREIEDDEAKLFIAKYHYFGRIGRNSIKYGALLRDKLIAVCCFANITRLETATHLKVKTNEIRELTRFCIHPAYQKKNLASWFLSRCINMFKIKFPNLKVLVAFSDTTYNHIGTIYKSSNWTLDGIVKPDYWYANDEGYIMHKKTLWDHACKMGYSESEYASKFGYRKVMGKEKTRWIFNIL